MAAITGASNNKSKPIDEKTKRYLDCLQARVGSRDLNTIKDLSNLCRDNMYSNHQPIKQLGLQTPEEFAKGIAAQEADLKLKMDKFKQEDVVVVIKDHIQLKETEAETVDLSHVDPDILALSKDVETILVKLHQSADVKQVALNLEKAGKNTGKEELLELSQLLSSMNGQESICKKLEDDPLHAEKDYIKNLPDHGKVFLGVVTNEDLAKLQSYRFQEGENFYYLYRSLKEANNEEKWILAKMDKDGKLSFRYYEILSDQGQGEAIAKHGDLKLISPGNHQTVLSTEEQKRFYLQSQEGLIVKRKKTSGPIIGEAMIPTGDLIISQVNMNYVASNTFNQNNLSLTQDSVGLQSVATSRNTTAWAASGGVKYYPLNDRWRANTDIRVYNMLLTYTNDFKGNADARATYLFDNNFISFNTDMGSNHQASAGRQFMQGRGAATVTSDFKKYTGVKLIFIVQ